MTPKIITALDVPSSGEMEKLIESLPDELEWYKVGLELFCAEGPDALAPLKERGKNIFLDIKLHDIPRTVARAVRSAAEHKVQLLTLHASGGREMLRAAAEAAAEFGQDRPKLLAVTVLTSLDATDLAELGIERTPSQQVESLAEIAMEAGIDGLVCSPQEVGSLRKKLGPTPLLATPGIRLPSSAADDQKRVATPADAVRDGASHLVIGRPITQAQNPYSALNSILSDIAENV